jgi:phenylpyruvate tautomerase PptA (4-oxalocrotonate tautomerase family)
MPLVRISIPEGWDKDFAKAVSDGIHDAMVATIDIPADDRFQVITEHDKSLLVADPHYLGINRSDGAILVEITLRSGRSDDKKRALYRTIVENLQARAGVRKEDVIVTLVENEPIDWSFGNGVAQYAPG